MRLWPRPWLAGRWINWLSLAVRGVPNTHPEEDWFGQDNWSGSPNRGLRELSHCSAFAPYTSKRHDIAYCFEVFQNFFLVRAPKGYVNTSETFASLRGVHWRVLEEETGALMQPEVLRDHIEPGMTQSSRYKLRRVLFATTDFF